MISFLVGKARVEKDVLQCLIRHIFLWALLACESVSKQVTMDPTACRGVFVCMRESHIAVLESYFFLSSLEIG